MTCNDVDPARRKHDHDSTMQRQSDDVTKIGLYIISAFLLAALTSPWLYNAGQFLAEFTAKNPEGGFLKDIGDSARKADFATYFKRALLISGVVLLLPLIYALRMGNRVPPLANSPWSIYLPRHTVAKAGGQPLRNPASGWIQLIVGFIIAGGLLFAMGLMLVSMGWFSWEDPMDLDRGIKKAVGPAIGASLVEEFVFRAMLLGVFLRTFRPIWAITFLSFVFSALHFLQPPDELVVRDPESSLAGFEMLKLIGLRFLDPVSFINEFTTLFVVGLILGFARYATASLWLPIGLHAGWVFAFKLFNRISNKNPDFEERYNIFIGSDLKEGLIPIITLGITSVLVYLFTKAIKPPPPPIAEKEEPSPTES